jgi:hypothetical protein
MFKKRFSRRFVAVLGTFAIVTSLIGIAVAGTGAYFTDNSPGQIAGSVGSVKVSVGNAYMNFANLLPGQVQSQVVTVQNTGTGPEDIWLAFTNDNNAWSFANDLGQYGKFVINGNTYDNLNNSSANVQNPLTHGTPGISTGSFMSGSCSTVNRVPINYLPHLIFIQQLNAGDSYNFSVAFNFIACLSGDGPNTLWGSVANDFPGWTPTGMAATPLNFKIAAFQAGVAPADAFNGTGAIGPLTGLYGVYTQQ